MRPGKKMLRDLSLLAGALMMLAVPISSGRAQTAAPAGNLADQLVGLEATPEIDIVALRHQATERVKSKADPQPQKRPAIAPQLFKLPQFRFDVLFDPDTSIMRPEAYQTLGRIADALYDPKLQPYKFLIVAHTDSTGRRDFNLPLSQRRADAIRDVLVTTFKVNAKRVYALGLGEEQLQDSNRPTSPANVRAQIMNIGKLFSESDQASPTAAPAQKKPAAAAKKKPRH